MEWANPLIAGFIEHFIQGGFRAFEILGYGIAVLALPPIISLISRSPSAVIGSGLLLTMVLFALAKTSASSEGVIFSGLIWFASLLLSFSGFPARRNATRLSALERELESLRSQMNELRSHLESELLNRLNVKS